MPTLRELARRTREHRKNVLARGTTIDAPLPVPALELDIAGPAHGLKVAVVTDAQVKHGVPVDHLAAAGQYIAAKRPDVVVCIGDIADMESLSRHDAPGTLKKENKRYKLDVAAVRKAMDLLMTPIAQASDYKPVLVFTEGNHEDRIRRKVNDDPTLEGVISIDDLHLTDYGWTLYPFLQPVVIGGVAFAHYFPGGVMGRPISKAAEVLKKMHMSCFAGHQQGRQIAFDRRGDGRELTAIISGSFYQHNEDYLSPLGNLHWRGMYMLHEVKNGSFSEMALSLEYLLRRFGK